MDKSEILAFITKNPNGFLATADGNKPHVRPFGTFRADENGIIYFTQAPKDVCKQMVENPQIEVCYWANGVQIRVAGKVTHVEDMALKQAIAAKFGFVKVEVEQNGWDYLRVFNLKNAKATVQDRKDPRPTPGTPKTWIDL